MCSSYSRGDSEKTQQSFGLVQLELLSRGTWVSVSGYLTRDWTSTLRNGTGMASKMASCQCPSTQFSVIFNSPARNDF